MNTFLVSAGLASSNSLETVEKVRQILKESLLTDDNSASAIQERMDKKLVALSEDLLVSGSAECSTKRSGSCSLSAPGMRC